MPTKYERLIGDYCARQGIVVPAGFARLTPGRYAIIRTHLTPAKLIAKTWSKTADVLYYGAAPLAVAGLLQVNAKVPDNASAGDVEVVIQSGTSKSQTGLTVAVR